MQCMKCRRYITKPSALSGGLPVGPICAQRLGLVAQKQAKPSIARKLKVFWQAQRDLFEELLA